MSRAGEGQVKDAEADRDGDITGHLLRPKTWVHALYT